MNVALGVVIGLLFVVTVAAAENSTPTPPNPPTLAEVIAASTPADWRAIDDANAIYVELASGRVVIEIAPAFAPQHVANIKALAREGYYDGVWIVRSQDNYVVQWADPDATRPIKTGKRTLSAEFTRAIAPDLSFTRLPDFDGYAPEVGFTNSLPAARDPKTGRTWLAHCYAMVGAGRDNDADSGGGTELYVVNGHAPRHLDRNVTLVGRVVRGIELLTSLPRGAAPMGYFEKPEQRIRILSIRVAADVSEKDRLPLEVMRTDTPTFATLIESSRNRREDWFKVQAGHIELCNVPIPSRVRR